MTSLRSTLFESKVDARSSEPGGGIFRMNDSARARFGRLLTYLEADPENSGLLADAARTAIDIPDLDEADRLVARLRTDFPASDEGPYLAGLIAMHRKDFELASSLFEKLRVGASNPSLDFNLAWTRAMLGEKSAALALLDEAAVSQIPAAAMLKTQLLHEAGELSDALEVGRAALERFPNDSGLLAVVATLAIDAEELDLARTCATRSGNHPEGLAAAGALDLHDGDTASAKICFDSSLAGRDHNPRAWLGRGLVALIEHDPASAARDIDRGAEQFARHSGSWVAAGWAHYLAGDLHAARQRFERALAVDGNFAESHGSLAVIDIVSGDPEGGRRRMVTALRLNSACFSAALAKLLLSSGDAAQAQAIVKRALNTPIDNDGMTISAYMAKLTRPTIH